MGLICRKFALLLKDISPLVLDSIAVPQSFFLQGVSVARGLAQEVEVQVLRRLSNSMLGCDRPEDSMIRDRDPALMARMPSHMSRDRRVLYVHNSRYLYLYYLAVHAE